MKHTYIYIVDVLSRDSMDSLSDIEYMDVGWGSGRVGCGLSGGYRVLGLAILEGYPTWRMSSRSSSSHMTPKRMALGELAFPWFLIRSTIPLRVTWHSFVLVSGMCSLRFRVEHQLLYIIECWAWPRNSCRIGFSEYSNPECNVRRKRLLKCNP